LSEINDDDDDVESFGLPQEDARHRKKIKRQLANPD